MSAQAAPDPHPRSHPNANPQEASPRPAAPPVDELDAAVLFDRFEDGTLPERCLTHRQHVRVAWLYLERHAPLAAIGHFAAALRRLAAAYGKPRLYHETITWAYLLLIHERRQHSSGAAAGEAASGAGWETFAAANPDLFTWRPSILAAYYRDETLDSELARRTFVLPDRGVTTTGMGPAPRSANPAGS
jgi:hypothetical protein